MSLSQKLAAAIYHLFPKVVDPAGASIVDQEPSGRLADLRGRHCVVVSFRKTGQPIATPVWFGSDGTRLYFRTLTQGYKVRRMRRNPEVWVAPCTTRGKPTGPPFRGKARVLTPEESEYAEAEIQRNFRLGRLAYKRAVRDAEAVYVEVTPLPTKHPEAAPAPDDLALGPEACAAR